VRAIRRLNNNVVVGLDSAGREVVIMGKGVGFGDLPRELPLHQVERTFYDIDASGQTVMRDLPAEVISFSARIIDIASNELPYPLSPNAVLLLADHISFAIQRTKKQLHVGMPLAYDVKQMYPMEYRLGAYAVERLRKEFQVGLQSDEAVGIALNLVNAKAAAEKGEDGDETAKVADMLEDVTGLVENYFHILVDRDSFNFSRYATHLQYLFQRIHRQTAIDSENLRLYGSLREEFPDISDCVEQISAHIKEKWGTDLSEEEKLYLILHVNRICAKEGM
jgi:beta-glucoside operon transcriptional antiterminator